MARARVRKGEDTTQAGSGRSESRQKGRRPKEPPKTPSVDRLFEPQPVGAEARLAPEPTAPEPVRGPNPDDRFAPLTAEHAELQASLEELQTFVGPDEERVERWNRIATALESHARAEEWELYPRARRHPVTRELANDGLAAHARLRELSRQVDARQVADPELSALLEELARVLRAHVQLEEEQLMPLCVQVLGKGEVDGLVAAYVRQRRKLEPAVRDERVRPGKPGKRTGRSAARFRPD